MILKKVKNKIFSETSFFLKTVPISQCVHYCGYRYGGIQYNPYESYIIQLCLKPENVQNNKREFINFLKYYRPHTLGEALGIKLENEYPLWIYPWGNYTKDTYTSKNGWVEEPDDIIDILTHFSPKGILSYMIDREFYWMERAAFSISKYGYLPDKFGFINALLLQKKDGQCALLLLDGNHRTSAIYASGQRNVTVKIYHENVVQEKNVKKWPGIRNGHFSYSDSLNIFHRYFEGNNVVSTTNVPAEILNYSNDYKLLENTSND